MQGTIKDTKKKKMGKIKEKHNSLKYEKDKKQKPSCLSYN